jgi:hypothetical protein
MARITITAVFDSRSKAEEAVSRLSELGLTDVFMKTSRYLPDFSPSGLGALSFFFGGGRDIEFTTVTGSLPSSGADEAGRIIKKLGGVM